jgi:hypothetical protein
MKKREGGQILVVVILCMAVLLIMVPALVRWVQNEAKFSVKDRRSTTAFNLAEAAVERGYWKVKGSTGTCAEALAGQNIPGYRFDVTYTDVSGGTYRIYISSAGPKDIYIIGEGRDPSNFEVRAVSATYQNLTLYSPLLATGTINYAKGITVFWGPMMSQGNITIMDDFVGQWYYPRKFAKGVVSGTVANPRDTNGLLPPNTDNSEWWSNYQAVPELPILDFVALRSSAAATNTLNVYGCAASGVHTSTGVAPGFMEAGNAPWDGRGACSNTGAHNLHFSASYNHPLGAKANPYQANTPAGSPLVWYYDGDLILGGDMTINGTYGIGLWGTLIVRGNLTLDANGDYNYTGNVPVNAWMEESKLTINTNDTAATGEYPADLGLHTTNATFKFGSDGFCVPGVSCGWINTVGRRGFTYVGGNLTVTNNGFMDFNGAVWVNGQVIATGADSSHFCFILYDDGLTLPTLNVILTRTSWLEVSPSHSAWH